MLKIGGEPFDRNGLENPARRLVRRFPYVELVFVYADGMPQDGSSTVRQLATV
jgi:hypothetical protein